MSAVPRLVAAIVAIAPFAVVADITAPVAIVRLLKADVAELAPLPDPVVFIGWSFRL